MKIMKGSTDRSSKMSQNDRKMSFHVKTID